MTEAVTTEKRKYHTIRVPVKKTSSEYFTMLRRGKVEPEKVLRILRSKASSEI